MSRPLRIEYENAYYHVMNRGLNYSPIYKTNQHYQMFLELLGQTRRRFGLEIHAYCLLNNHYHLLLQTPRGNLSRIMRHIDGVYTQRYNRSTKRDGPLFRGRYKAILIEADTYLEQVSRYIHLNPVKAKLVKNAESYKWSSYKAYISSDKQVPDWLNTRQILEQMNSNYACEKYRAYVELGIDDEIQKFYATKNRSSILGSKNFKNLQLEELNNKKIKASLPDIKRTQDMPNINEIIILIAAYYQKTIEDIKQAKPGTKNLPRLFSMHICSNIYGHKIKHIANEYATSPSAVSVFISRLSKKLKQNSELQQEYNTLAAWLCHQHKSQVGT